MHLKLGKAIIPILFVLFNVALLVYPQEVLEAARGGLLLWFNRVLPALLPFVIGMNMLMGLGVMRAVGALMAPLMRVVGLPGAGGAALLAGLTSGYPLGAKTVADLHRTGQITTAQGQRLMAFCNNAGPLFIVGVVGVGMLGNARLGYLLWVGHVLAALLLGVAFQLFSHTMAAPEERTAHPWRRAVQAYRAYRRENRTTVGHVLSFSVKNAMETMVMVGGYIIFFSVAARVLGLVVGTEAQLSPYIQGLFAGALEMTGGAHTLATAPPGHLQLALLAGVLGFGGLSVHAQALHFTVDTGIKAGPYLLAKLAHGVLAAVLTIFIAQAMTR